MLRIILTYGLPLILPTVLFLLWAHFAPRRKAEGESEGAGQVEIPWLWLAAAGVLLAGVTVGAFSLSDKAPPGAVYEPAHIDKDGNFVPGRAK
jgi:hypothetical protein